MEQTRLCFLGDVSLAHGFRLAGFEVYPDISVAGMEKVLRELCNTRTRAFVILDQRLSESDSDMLEYIRREGGRIVLSQVPPMNQPDAMQSSVDTHIAQLLGETQ